MTEWRAVSGYEGYYEVSDFGQVRSLLRVVPSTARGARRTIYPRVLKARLDHNGYPIVTLTMKSKARLVPVHRLVALAFHGDKRSALHCEVAHLDGRRANPRASNLKWASKVENNSHKRLHGTEQIGERNPNAKLTAELALQIRDRARAGGKPRKLGREFGVHEKHVIAIRDGRLWRHLDQDCQARACKASHNLHLYQTLYPIKESGDGPRNPILRCLAVWLFCRSLTRMFPRR